MKKGTAKRRSLSFTNRAHKGSNISEQQEQQQLEQRQELQQQLVKLK
jgi:hypothetical protein